MPEQISLRNLQAFEAIGRCGGVTAAARDLGVSPGAISQHVHLIEENLGVKLIERRGRTVELTSWGKLYYQELAKGFSQIRGAEDVISRARNADAIVLSALPSVASRWIGQRIFDWHEQHPDSNIRVVGTGNEPRLGRDAADFRITFWPVRRSNAPKTSSRCRFSTYPGTSDTSHSRDGPIGHP
jgi:LysR family transcriptional regulator, glycine cleavage system transcriptional activator